MHTVQASVRALAIEELVIRVIGFADIRTAAASSLVCRLWSLPGLDKVWCKVGTEEGGPQLKDLWLLVPMDDEMDDAGMDTRCLGRERNPSSSDTLAPVIPIANWSRFAQYARRIQVLNLTDDHVVYAEPHIRLLTSCPLSEPLFPRLRVLYARSRFDHSTLVPYMSKFLCTSIREMTLMLATRDEESESNANEFVAELDVRKWLISEFFKEVLRKALFLEKISLQRAVNSLGAEEVEEGILTLLTELRQLISISIESALFTERVLRRVLHKSLCSLRLHTEFRISHFDNTLRLLNCAQSLTPKDQPVLPTLNQLSLSLPTYRIPPFLDAIRPSLHRTLRSLVLDLGEVTCTNDFYSCMYQLSQIQALQEVKIMQHSRIHILPYSMYNRLALSPLKKLKELTEFRLEHGYPNDMTDEEIIELVRSCPRLHTIEIVRWRGIRVYGETPSRFTLGMLASLSNQPNCLRSLRFHLHTYEVFPSRGIGHVESSTLREHTLLALDAIGPHLKRPAGSRFVDIAFDDRAYDVNYVERITDDHRLVYSYLERCLGNEEAAGRAFASFRRLQESPEFV